MQALLLFIHRYLAHFFPSLYHYTLLCVLAVLVLFLLARRKKQRSWYLFLLITALLFMVSGRSLRSTALSLPLPKDRCTALTGTLVEDSSLTRKESQLLRLSLSEASAEEVGGEAAGLVPVLIALTEVIVANTAVVVEGAFFDELFIATNLQVLTITRLGELRRRVFALLDRRLSRFLGESEAKALAMLLLLGQSESESFPLKDGALSCGCAHVLALSGMHLSFLITLSTTLCSLFLPQRWGRRVGLIPPLLFITVAGPKPSLIRSAFVRLGCEVGLGIECAATVAYLLQLVLFAESIRSPAALYSWAAFLGLLLCRYLPPLPGRLTAVAIAATAPLTISLSGEWNAAGLLFSPLAALSISVAMLISVALVCAGALFAPAMHWITRTLIHLFDLGAKERLWFGPLGYGGYLFILLTLFATVGYAEVASFRRRRQDYAVGVRIRLTEGDQSTIGKEGVRCDEEVWTKLSSHRISSPRDCPSPCLGAEAEGD